ncbi:MAG: CHAT domain-containing protein [bacterium]|nr:CHAT domain-containing protein [bacterium]
MTKTDTYDFHLAVERDPQGGFVTRILRSLEGRGTASFHPPDPLATAAGTSLRQEAEARGRALFDALFDGPVGEKYRRSLARLEAVRDGRSRSLCVRLAIDPDVPELASLFELDWEQMFDEDRDRFLTRSRRTTLVRDLELPIVLLDLPGTRPLRILVVGAQPDGWPVLDFDDEVERIRTTWAECDDVVIETMPRARLRDLEARLERGNAVHILHFIGHGTVDEAEVEGMLLFERRDGSEHPVTGKELAERLESDPNLRLAVLNACETAKGPRGTPSRSVAASLMNAGVPAVVAMRYRVPDPSAVAFSDGFYRALAAGKEVDAAITAARLDIDDTEDLFWHWATPALFMSSLDGRIFQFSGAMAPKRLGVRTRHHPFDKLEDECDHVLDLVPFFEGRPIRDPEDWEDKVLPYLDSFLRQHVRTRRSLILRLDTHLTVSFAAGRLIDTRGVDVTIRQALPSSGFIDWNVDFDRPWDGPLWKICDLDLPESAGNEVALAIGITSDATAPVERYVKRHLANRVGRILAATIDPVPSNTSVRNADHALALAQDLKRRIEARTEEEQAGPLHLFFATPGTFAFFLGQLSRGFGEIQLYEWEFEKRGSREYSPSLRIVPEEGGRR